ncbi:protein-glutamine gamma-glutamyltransferase [Salibacterium aidingense]|uniref:protein-glutamine gamma-glutamyltransferase n=1 Tax=Salibacterium aidingense TaxID=384933 RepID=UPI0003FD5626|nr:protein-glutamine gamma-glutamyltransferase [Salibacterium aidingense]
MIYLSGSLLQQPPSTISGETETMIFQRLQNDNAAHSYQSLDELLFELQLRKNIINSSHALHQSDAAFEIFAETRANPEYWNVTNAGGLRLRYGRQPAEALSDIFRNSSAYGFECATAMIIIFYHAALQVIGKTAFNNLFPNLYLYSWHIDSDLGLESVQTPYFIPGDVVYFNNPDFNSQSPQWRGENAVVLNENSYFGHGIGITTEAEMIRILNDLRNPGSQQSAYLTNVVTRADSSRLYQQSRPFRNNSWIQKIPSVVIQHNENSISHERYQQYLHDWK